MAKPDPDWQTWYDALAARLVLYARQWLPERADAEDAVQAGFVKFWRSRATPEAADLPLLFTAVRTAALDLAKSRRRRVDREQRVAGGGRRTGGLVGRRHARLPARGGPRRRDLPAGRPPLIVRCSRHWL